MDQSGYVQAVKEVVEDLLANSSQAKAAMLGAVLKSRDLDWTRYGFARLKDVLIALSASSDLTFGPDEKDALAVWRSDTPSRSAGEVTPQRWSSRSLKKPVWTAFVSETVTSRRAIDRRSGTVWLSTSEPPLESGDWVAVQAIPGDEQRDWARSFLESKGLSSEPALGRSLETDSWYREFPNALEQNHSDLRRAWNRERTNRVIERVIDWCREHAVSPHLLFDARMPSTVSGPADSRTSSNLRDALLQAIQQLPTEQLLQIRLPARALVEALRPDLLR